MSLLDELRALTRAAETAAKEWPGKRVVRADEVDAIISRQPEPAVTYSERDMTEMIEDRDRCMEWADKLAYAIAPVAVIGEHSSANDPWQNALELAEAITYTKEAQ